MLDRIPQGVPGQRLKRLRLALGLNTREVEAYSRKIASDQSKEGFYIAHSWLTEIENSHIAPSVYKLYTLSVVYGISFIDMLLIYGIDLERITQSQITIKLPKTHLVASQVYDPDRMVTFPVKFDPGVRLTETNLLSRMVETWGEVPIAFVQHLGIRNDLYGYIGLEDYTLYPLIRPGSFVQIDAQDTKIETSASENDFERPIYFFQLRDGYACGWCQLDGRLLSLIPHSLSRQAIRQFAYPNEVDVVGRVTGLAMPLPRLPARSSPALESKIQ